MKERSNPPSPIPTPLSLHSQPSPELHQDNHDQSDDHGGDDSPYIKHVTFSQAEHATMPATVVKPPGEDSPLLHSEASAGDTSPVSALSSDDWEDGKSQDTKSAWYMFLLTVAGFGLQMGWSVEMSNGSPYLLSLGLSKTMLAFVWIAGPLSGVLAQPYVGIKSDRSQNKWGKRRPYLVGGTLATVLSLMMLAWAREIVGGLLSLFGIARDSKATSICIMVFAVVFIYVLDFAINVLQAALRAFIVDCAPVHQQEAANAWVSRTCGIGNIFGMFCGGVNLPKALPFLGNTQFKVLCAIASLSMLLTTGMSATIRERDPTRDGTPVKEEGLLAVFRDLYRAIGRLPTQIMRVCQVQFMAWIGWFPFLFYTTTYIAEMYVDPIYQENPHLSPEEANKVWEEGTRRGTIALLIYSLVTFIASVVLPWMIEPAYQAPITTQSPGTPLMASSEHGLCSQSTNSSSKPQTLSEQYAHRFGSLVEALISKLRIPGLTLRRAWFMAHIMFATCMLLTFIIQGVFMATLLVGLIGIPWAIAQWAPFALIASEISKRDAIRRGLLRPPPTHDGELLASNEDHSADQAGVVLGIHNVAVSAPQVIATLVSSLIFKGLSKPRGTPGDDSVAWCMRFGGICALLAAWLTLRVGEDKEGLTDQDARSGEDRRRLLGHDEA
ncbi:uncharacterized protein PV09_07793 [Verruconis gallopava]|uniref:General alpha-glucoside permease n=1 Tax=Verruconis gallopava TaxID=253628 RepID=A0A0D2ANW1_9PEZI|nr:uncharacterized protein PV09_07793 [Verruconis gallopava]KIW00814.1 hypothetical protein PV09_07793 [Verruconis gallopava]